MSNRVLNVGEHRPQYIFDNFVLIKTNVTYVLFGMNDNLIRTLFRIS